MALPNNPTQLDVVKAIKDLESQPSGSATDVQINGTSITSGGVANIVTKTAYDATTNKIATENDIPTVPDELADLADDSTHRLVTDTEKSTWNGKQDALSSQTAYSAKGSATKVPQITTNSLGQVTGITEVTITQPTVDQTYNASSTNAQSGVAVASAISPVAEMANGKTNTYIIQHQSDITGTKDANDEYTSVTAITGVTIANLKLGDVILIKDLEVPDYWVSQISPSVSLNKMETTKVVVPTKVSDLQNDSGFLTSSTGVTSVNGSTGAITGVATTSDLNSYLPLSAGSSKPLTDYLYLGSTADAEKRIVFGATGSKSMIRFAASGQMFYNAVSHCFRKYNDGNGLKIDSTNATVASEDDNIYSLGTSDKRWTAVHSNGNYWAYKSALGYNGFIIKQKGYKLGANGSGSSSTQGLGGYIVQDSGTSDAGGWMTVLESRLLDYKDNAIPQTNLHLGVRQATTSAGSAFKQAFLDLVATSSDSWMTVSQRLLPASTNSYSLGSAGLIWSEIYGSRFITKNTTVAYSDAPETTVGQYVRFYDKNNTAIADVYSAIATAKNSLNFALRNKSNGVRTIEFSHSSDGWVVRPSNSDSVSLGTSSYVWKNIYGKNIYAKNTSYAYNEQPDSNSWINKYYFTDKNNATLGAISGGILTNGNAIEIGLNNKDGAWNGIRYVNSGLAGASHAYSFRPNNNNDTDLGASGTTWKNIYGVNVYASSDRRLKENIKPAELDCSKVIDDLQIKEFNFKADEEKKVVVGAIAQELKAILPEKYQAELVDGSEDTSYSINEGKLLYVAIGALKDEMKKTRELEERLARIEKLLEK